MLISFEGIDGAGKSLLARGLVERLRDAGLAAKLLEKKAIPPLTPGSAQRLAHLRDAIWAEEQSEDVLGTHFSLYLLAAWYSAIGRCVSRDAGELAIIDGWYHRVVAKAFLRGGFDRAWLASLFEHIPRPAYTILLDIDPGLSFDRKRTFTASELGHWDGCRSGELRRDFISYQRRVRSELLAAAREHGWVIVAQDGRAPDELLDQICTLLLDTLHPASAEREAM
ncbi:MAG: hypothetical protein ACTHU0_31875 [Kofleriaceae bacterium]